MRYLLDAHSIIWALDNPSRLGKGAVTVLENSANDLVVSTATIWEMAIKVGLKKLSLSLPFREWMERAVADLGLTVSTITLDITAKQIALPFHHRDPFDRILVAHCLVESIPLVTADVVFERYNVIRVWDKPGTA